VRDVSDGQAIAEADGVGLVTVARWSGRDAASTARIATLVVFVTHALLFASWTAHIPLVKSSLGLTDAQLGLALFGAPFGSIIAMLATSSLIPRLGSRRMVQLCLVGACATGWTVGMAGSGPELFAALTLWGLFLGALDVSMNAQAVFVERGLGRPIMSSFHGVWSIGAFVGVAVGALAVAAGVALAAQLAILGVLGLLIAGPATTVMLTDPAREPGVDPGGRAASVWRNPVVLLVCGVVLVAMLCEGAAADWSAVYLHESLGTTVAFAALGYAAFSVSMVAGRLSGDRLLARVSPRTVLPVLAVVATVGMTMALIVGGPAVALLGFVTLGIGVALVVPAAFTAAGRLPGVHPGAAVAVVSSIGFVGFVAGPPLIGHLADAASLAVALALLPILTGVIALVVRASRSFDPAPASGVSAPDGPRT